MYRIKLLTTTEVEGLSVSARAKRAFLDELFFLLMFYPSAATLSRTPINVFVMCLRRQLLKIKCDELMFFHVGLRGRVFKGNSKDASNIVIKHLANTCIQQDNSPRFKHKNVKN